MTFGDLEKQILAFPRGYVSGVGVTDIDIKGAEGVLGLKINGSYRLFLLRFGWIDIATMELFGLGKDVPPYLNLVTITLSERSEAHPALSPLLLPVFNDGGGNLYCLDSSTENLDEYPVVFWDHELGPSQKPDFVSSSFSEWLSEEIGQRR